MTNQTAATKTKDDYQIAHRNHRIIRHYETNKDGEHAEYQIRAARSHLRFIPTNILKAAFDSMK